MTPGFDKLKKALADRYAIEREIGEGGMATVYLATDLKLDRKVAIKVLKPELAAIIGAERFLAEIKTTATLQHPHILPLFDSGEADSLLYYVMPYVDGESLREKLDRERQLSVEEATRIAQEVSEALEHAHGRGIIHRDIKPANILLQEGRVIVADFGIALAVSEAGAGRLTETGLSLGTPSYMSPEQATGDRAVDKRSDLYSLGCIVHEMLAGEPPHTGPTAQSVMAKILTDEATSLSSLRKTVPANIESSVLKALEKLPGDRFPDVGSFAAALGDERFRYPAVEAATHRKSSVDGANTWRRPTIGRVAAATVVLLLAGWGWLKLAEEPPRAVVRGALEAPSEARVMPNLGFRLSPDGRALAYVAGDADGARRIWVQSLDALEGHPLEGTEGASRPFWSPDGQDLGFFAEGSLKRIPAAGGAVTVLAPVSLNQPKGGTWSPDGRIVYVPDYRTGLFEIPAEGGDPRALTEVDAADGELSHRWPQFLPDGRSLLFLVQTHEYGAEDDQSRIEVRDADGERREVLGVNSSAAYASPGELLYWREGSVYSSQLDVGEWRVRGAPRVVAEGVGFNSSEYATFTVSTEGTLVYHIGEALPWRLEWRDRTGRLLSIEEPEGDYSFPGLSPDDRYVAYREGTATLWVLDLSRGTRNRLTFEEADHYSPTWSPDGEWIAYSADKTDGPGSDIYRRRSSGAGERELLYGAGTRMIQDLTWSPDGRRIAFNMTDDLYLLDLESGEAQIAVATPGDDYFASFSPDGSWLAFTSDESGRDEIYVSAVGEPAGNWLVSQRGGFRPQWSASGDELFFLGLDYELRVATVELGPPPKFGVPELLFKISSPGEGHRFDVASDGRILVRTHAAQANAQNFKMILNWPELLDQPSR